MRNTPLGLLRTVILRVDDMEAACRFYSTTLGLSPMFRDGDRWAQFDAGGVALALAAEAETPFAATALAIKVPDVQAALAHVVAGGGTLLAPATAGRHEIHGAARDPSGHVLTFYQSRPPE